MKHNDVIVIVARQRSGTTALARMLDEAPDIHSFGEVFHHQATLADDKKIKGNLFVDPKSNFFLFRRGLFARHPNLAVPSVENQTEILDRFLGHLRSLTDKKRILIDVKYNSWHNFEAIYAPPSSSNMMFFLLNQLDAKFIHIIRRNAFERYCSEQIALRDANWHLARGSKVPDIEKITIDPRAALSDMIETQRQMDVFNNHFSNVKRRIELVYEDTYAGNKITGQAHQKLSRLLGEGWQSGKPVPLAKVTPPLSSVIGNVDEVLAYFRSTTYSDMVNSSLLKK